MRNIDEMPVAKKIRQAVLAVVRLPMRYLLRRPKVPSPSQESQYQKHHEGGRQNNGESGVVSQSIAEAFLFGGYPG